MITTCFEADGMQKGDASVPGLSLYGLAICYDF
jgi:hypothetical protein